MSMSKADCRPRSWEDKDGQKRYTTEVVCEELILLSGRSGGGGESGGVSTPGHGGIPTAIGAASLACGRAAGRFQSGHHGNDDVPF